MVSKSILMVVTESTYNKRILDVVKNASSGPVCYVSFNKTYGALVELFKKHKANVKNIKFIDCISQNITDVKNTADCTFISSPEAITELSIVLNTHLEYGFKTVVFDSLTNLATYADMGTVKKFVKNLVSKLDGVKTDVIIFAVDLKEHEALIKSVGTFVDEVKK
jgi:archaellum biogenesis ATPase FlaH